MTPGQRRTIFIFATIVMVMVVIETAAAATTRILVDWGWMAGISTVSREWFAAYVAHRNSMLGWGPAVGANGLIVRLEPRPDPGFDEHAPPCVSAYGDSFTFGSEVDDGEAYPHVLGARMGCRVANYGVGGYGTDQALMLARAQQRLDRAPVTVIGHVTEDLMRNINQCRNLLYSVTEGTLSLKPAFALENGQLRSVPIPVTTEADLDAFEHDPDSYLPYDAFRLRPRRAFPYTLTIVRWLFTDFHVRAHLAGVPRHLDYYAPDHPSHALPLTAAILRAFAREAVARGQEPLVLLIPVGRDLQYHARTGHWVDQPLVDALGSAVRVIHGGSLIAARLGSADPCTLFGNCYGHFNARGYAMLADVVFEAIQRDGALAGARRLTP